MGIKILGNKIALLISLVVIHYNLNNTSGIGKYIIVLSIATLISLIYSRKKITLKPLIFMVPSLFYSIYGLSLSVYNERVSYNSIKQILFYILPIIVAILMYTILSKKTFSKIIDVQFWALCITFLLINYLNTSSLFFGESHLAFIFGIYTLFFLYKKNYKLFILALVFTILANKRIALFALIICSLIIIFMKVLKNSNKVRLMSGINIVTVLTMYMYVYMCSNGMISQLLQSNGIVSQGRIDVWNMFVQDYEFSPLYKGQGIGYVTDKLDNLNISSFSLIHNDVLSAYIELGFLGFGIWVISHLFIVAYIKKKSANYNNAFFINLLYIYTFIIYFTDNASIYLNYLLPFYMIVLLFSNQKANYKIKLDE